MTGDAIEQPHGHAGTGCEVALLTKHAKQHAVAPALAGLGWSVRVTDGFDTDRLGTFSRTRPRPQSPLVCGREKARRAMALTGLSRGLGSEGSFGGGPLPGLIPWNEELLVLVDDGIGIELVGRAQGTFEYPHEICGDVDAVLHFVRAQPSGQHFIMRPDHADHPDVITGLLEEREIAKAVHNCLASARNGQLVVEYDLRADRSPTRMNRIAEAARDLVAKWRTQCPACGAPGFCVERVEPGLVCSACGLPTDQVGARIQQCRLCVHTQHEAVPGQADPAQCQRCNP